MKFIHERYYLHRTLVRESSFNREHSDEQRISFTLTPIEEEKQLALISETRMVYVLSKNREILYVGEGYTDIKSRMNRGFIPRRYFARTGTARNGYKGYKWIDLLIPQDAAPLTLDVFMFEEEFNDDALRCIIEGIEGELVYLIRSHTERWPEYQNEIHFSNQEGTAEVAKKIYEIVDQSHEQ